MTPQFTLGMILLHNAQRYTTHLDHFISIIDPNRCHEFGRKYILIKSQHQGSFTASRIPHHE